MKINLAKFPKDDSIKCQCGAVAEYSFYEFITKTTFIVCEDHIPQAWKEASGK